MEGIAAPAGNGGISVKTNFESVLDLKAEGPAFLPGPVTPRERG